MIEEDTISKAQMAIPTAPIHFAELIKESLANNKRIVLVLIIPLLVTEIVWKQLAKYNPNR